MQTEIWATAGEDIKRGQMVVVDWEAGYATVRLVTREDVGLKAELPVRRKRWSRVRTLWRGTKMWRRR